MCYFVLVAFPPEAIPAARAQLRSTFGMRPANNPSLDASLPAGWSAFLLNDGMCGCDMYSHPDRKEVAVPPAERARAFREKHAKPKYRKRGWTEERIERAIAQMQEPDRAPAARGFTGLRGDVRKALAEVARAAGPARLLVHRFSGIIEKERLSLAGEHRVDAAELVAGTTPVQADVLYEIVPAEVLTT